MLRHTEKGEQALLSMSDLIATVGKENLAKLKEMHQAEGRYYHTWDHALSVLKRSLELGLGDVSRRAYALAAIFHDAIYVVGAQDNEERSAKLLFEMCTPREQDSVFFAADLINSTAKHAIATTENTLPHHRDFMDCDILSIAEPCWPLVVQNDWNVQAEYLQKLPLNQVISGRKNFLVSWLEKPSIFIGRALGQHNEWQARQNIRRLLEVRHDFSEITTTHSVADTSSDGI